MGILEYMSSTSSLLPPPNPPLLEAIRKRFIAEMRDRQAKGMTKQGFQEETWNWAVKKRMIEDGIPWLTADRAAEAYDDPTKFAHDTQTHPWGLLTALEMWGDDFPVYDFQVIRISWMEERK
jgi:hypothetical protein